jgi:hypothetical protein
MFAGAAFAIFLLVFVAVAAKRVFTRRGRRAIGPAAAGTFYEMLSHDRREAAQVVIEERAEARDPEDKDGNLPDLAGMRKR